MLKTQEYLHGYGLERLCQELGIKAVHHDTLPLMILNYNQIVSPKTHPVVRECRGLILRNDTFELVARSFPRFFNWGEIREEMDLFDFSDFSVQSKEDGSLVIIFNFDGEWHIATRGAFAGGNLPGFGGTWKEAVLAAMGLIRADDLHEHLDPFVTYVGEFCSPWNKVVRYYKEPKVFLLGCFCGEGELSELDVRDNATPRNSTIFADIRRHEFDCIEGIQKFLEDNSKEDPTFEGVVIKDCNGQRWKIKSASYLGLHRMRGEGENLYHPKHLLPFVLNCDAGELLTYFPEARPSYDKCRADVAEAYADVLKLWGDCKDIPEQKDFAMAVKESPFASVLFSVRKKHGAAQRACDVDAEWRGSSQVILKRLFQ